MWISESKCIYIYIFEIWIDFIRLFSEDVRAQCIKWLFKPFFDLQWSGLWVFPTEHLIFTWISLMTRDADPYFITCISHLHFFLWKCLMRFFGSSFCWAFKIIFTLIYGSSFYVIAVLASGLLPTLYIFSGCFLLSNVMILTMLFAIQERSIFILGRQDFSLFVSGF